MDFEDLIVSAGEKLGIEGMRPNDAGVVAIGSDTLQIVISWDQAADRVLLQGSFGMLPETAADSFCRMMLRANDGLRATGGATLSLSEADDRILLVRSEPLAGLEVDGFIDLLQRFADTLGVWEENLAQFSLVGPEINARRSAAGGVTPLGVDIV